MYKNFFILCLQIKKSIDHFKVRHNEMLNFYLARAVLLLLKKKKKCIFGNNWKNKLDEFLLEEEERKKLFLTS